MKQAYIILKKKQNIELYGNEWLFASPDPFTNRIDIKVIAQQEGTIILTLIDKDGNTVKSLALNTEEQEIYDTTFTSLDSLPPGNYSVQYKDNENTRTVILNKNGVIMKDWLVGAPVPFNTLFTVYLKAPETGKISIRLIDAAGRIITSTTMEVQLNYYYTIPFGNTTALPKGVYFVQYIGTTKKTIKILK